MSIGLQFPDEFMLHQEETMRIFNRKEQRNVLMQTEDLLEGEMMEQLREWRERYGVKVYPY